MSRWNQRLESYQSRCVLSLQQQPLTMQVQSFVTHVRFTEATAAIPKDVVLLEVGPHALLRAPLRQNLPGHQYAPRSRNLPPSLFACNVKRGIKSQDMAGGASYIRIANAMQQLLQQACACFG